MAYRIPAADELPERLGPVLATIYLSYTEGHSATAGDELLRPALTGEAIRIGRTLVAFYDHLQRLRPNAVVALNRAIALAEVQGPRTALDTLAAIPERDVLASYPFYPATLGELHRRLGDLDEAARHLERAIALTSSPAEKHFLREKLDACRDRQSARSMENSSA